MMHTYRRVGAMFACNNGPSPTKKKGCGPTPNVRMAEEGGRTEKNETRSEVVIVGTVVLVRKNPRGILYTRADPRESQRTDIILRTTIF
jgi:hypothetical protein